MASSKLIAKTLDAAEFFGGDLSAFIDTIVKVHSFEGASRSSFYSCEYEGVKFFVKLSLHSRPLVETKGGLTQVDTELAILRALKKDVLDTHKSPCVLEVIHAMVRGGVAGMLPGRNICDQLTNGMREPSTIRDSVYLTLCKYADLIESDIAFDKVTFMVLDKCNFSLSVYLRGYTESPVHFAIMKSILFMIIHVFCVFQEKWPKFRHADLHLGNVMLSIDANYKFTGRSKYVILQFDGRKFAVPYFGIYPKIIDFGHSAIPELGIKSPALAEDTFLFRRSENDLLFLFYCIYNTVPHTRDITQLLSVLEPNLTYIKYYTPTIRKIEDKIPGYRDMLMNPVFDYCAIEKIRAEDIYEEFA
jgi:hypothetical protein